MPNLVKLSYSCLIGGVGGGKQGWGVESRGGTWGDKAGIRARVRARVRVRVGLGLGPPPLGVGPPTLGVRATPLRLGPPIRVKATPRVRATCYSLPPTPQPLPPLAIPF